MKSFVTSPLGFITLLVPLLTSIRHCESKSNKLLFSKFFNKDKDKKFDIENIDETFVNDLKRGFHSGAAWEIYAHVVLEPRMTESFPNTEGGRVKREHPVSGLGDCVKKHLEPRQISYSEIKDGIKSVDFYGKAGGTEYYVEFKVETKKGGTERRFAGKDLETAMLTDIFKLQCISQTITRTNEPEGRFYSILIAQNSKDTREKLQEFLIKEKTNRQANQQNEPANHDLCWHAMTVEGILVVTFAVAKNGSDEGCKNLENKNGSLHIKDYDPNKLLKNAPANPNEMTFPTTTYLDDRLNFQTVGGLTASMANNLSDKFKVALDQGKQWEIYAQVWVWDLLRSADTTSIKREKDRYDVHFEIDKVRYHVELKVYTKDTRMYGGKSFDAAVNGDLTKLSHIDDKNNDNYKKKWMIIVMPPESKEHTTWRKKHAQDRENPADCGRQGSYDDYDPIRWGGREVQHCSVIPPGKNNGLIVFGIEVVQGVATKHRRKKHKPS